MWKAEPIHLPDRLAQRLDAESSDRLVGVGNSALLDRPLIGLLTSRECPGHVLLSTLDRIPEWVQDGWVILSGFHAPLEQQVMRSVLRRQGSVVKILARGLDTYRPLPLEREPLEAGRMLILAAAAPAVRRTTRASALERNRLVLKLATKRVVPYLATSSGLAALLLEDDIGTESTR